MLHRGERPNTARGHRRGRSAGDNLGSEDRVRASACARERPARGRRVRGRLAHSQRSSRLNRRDIGSVDNPGSGDVVSYRDSRGRIRAGSGEGGITGRSGGEGRGEEGVRDRDRNDAPGDARGTPSPVDQPAVTEIRGAGFSIGERYCKSPLQDGDGPVARIARDTGENQRSRCGHLRCRHGGGRDTGDNS